MNRPDIHETRQAVEHLGGDPVIADAALTNLGSGVKVGNAEVGKEPLGNTIISDQISGQEKVIEGGVPSASLRVTVDPTEALASNPVVEARHEEIERALGRKVF